MLHYQAFDLPPIGTNCWLITADGDPGAVVVDAPLNAWATVEKLVVTAGLRVEALLMTHGHWDHTLDAHRFSDAGIPVYAHAGDRLLYDEPSTMASFAIPGLSMQSVPVDHWIKGGRELTLLGESVEVREVPGHSQGSVLYYFKNAGFAASGDVVFRGSVGRTDFPGCSFQELESSILKQVYSLPPETILLPGHGPKTVVAEEMRDNPFVRA